MCTTHYSIKLQISMCKKTADIRSLNKINNVVKLFLQDDVYSSVFSRKAHYYCIPVPLPAATNGKNAGHNISRSRSDLGASPARLDQVWVHHQQAWTNKLPALKKQLGDPLTAAAAAAASWRNRTKVSAALTRSAADVIDKPLSRGRTKVDTTY